MLDRTIQLIERMSWHRNEIWGMIQTLAVNFPLICDTLQDDKQTAVGTDSDKIVMGAGCMLYKFSLLTTQTNHCNVFHTAVDDILN